MLTVRVQKAPVVRMHLNNEAEQVQCISTELCVCVFVYVCVCVCVLQLPAGWGRGHEMNPTKQDSAGRELCSIPSPSTRTWTWITKGTCVCVYVCVCVCACVCLCVCICVCVCTSIFCFCFFKVKGQHSRHWTFLLTSSRVDQPKVGIFFTEALIYFDNWKKGTQHEVLKKKTKKKI